MAFLHSYRTRTCAVDAVREIVDRDRFVCPGIATVFETPPFWHEACEIFNGDDAFDRDRKQSERTGARISRAKDRSIRIGL